jgi:hypothetical protein
MFSFSFSRFDRQNRLQEIDQRVSSENLDGKPKKISKAKTASCSKAADTKILEGKKLTEISVRLIFLQMLLFLAWTAPRTPNCLGLVGYVRPQFGASSAHLRRQIILGLRFFFFYKKDFFTALY